MPELDFAVTGAEAASRGLAPLLNFQLHIRSRPDTAAIQAMMLHAQIQLQCPQRAYNGEEKEKLVDLFGQPERWGATLRNRLLGFCTTTVRAFSGDTQTILPLPCTFDLNVAATKYFYALEGGAVPLLFLFSGSVFYAGAEGALQVEQISWSSESTYLMPVAVWQEMMEKHYPNSAWLSLHRHTFDRLCAFRRQQGLTDWDETMTRLLNFQEKEEAVV